MHHKCCLIAAMEVPEGEGATAHHTTREKLFQGMYFMHFHFIFLVQNGLHYNVTGHLDCCFKPF